METTQTNLPWHEISQVKKGDYGELLVKNFLESKGYVLYTPCTDAAHGFDGYAFKEHKMQFAFEVKTKPKCSKYPETGFSEYLFQRYERLSREENIRVMIFFVDESLGEIYGNYLDELNKPYKDPTQSKPYPKVVGHTGGENLTRYFPMQHMKYFTKLSPSAIEALKVLNRG